MKNKTILGRLKTIDCKLQDIIDKCTEEPVSLLTEFNISTLEGDGCFTPDLSPFDLTVWHDGEGEFPELGDTVYSDAAGTTLFVTDDPMNGADDRQMSNGEYLKTDINGIRIVISCK